MNILYDRKFDIAGDTNAHYDLKLGYPRRTRWRSMPCAPGARVLDIGCGPGYFDAHLAAKGCRVTGVDQFPPAMPEAFDDVRARR